MERRNNTKNKDKIYPYEWNNETLDTLQLIYGKDNLENMIELFYVGDSTRYNRAVDTLIEIHDGAIGSPQENRFMLSDAKMDKMEELDIHIRNILSKPIRIRDNHWGIDDVSIRKMEIRLSMINDGVDIYPVDVLDYKGNPLSTPKIERLRNLLGRMKIANGDVMVYKNTMVVLIDEQDTVANVNKIKFIDILKSVRDDMDSEMIVNGGGSYKNEVEIDLTTFAIGDMIGDIINDMFE